MLIGKIVRSNSHLNYDCHIFALHEVEVVPGPADYALGRFVRIKVRTLSVTAPTGRYGEQPLDDISLCAVGVISNTVRFNPAVASGGPRLSNEEQVEIFSPDALTDRITLVSLLLLGMMKTRNTASGTLHAFLQSHGVPPFSLEVGSCVEAMSEEEVRAFHLFTDKDDQETPYLHLGYLPHVQTQHNSLLPIVVLQIIEQLERLFPNHLALLSIIKRHFAWKLKIESIG